MRRRSNLVPRLLAAAAVVAAAALAVTWSPWQSGHGGFADRALAAIGDDPVLHAVVRAEVQQPYDLIEISSGQTRSQRQVVETELWYDRAAALKHSIVREGGSVVEDTLETPHGTTNMDGVVYTCAWIAAHPVEATREGVSCRFDGDNGTTPREIPEPTPWVDPALAAFVTGYRAQLESGRARKVGEGVVDGAPVYWVELAPSVPPAIPGSEPPPGQPSARVPTRERVAIDRESYRPILVRSQEGDSQTEYRILDVETVSKDEADFSEPTRRPASEEVSIGSVLDPVPATPADAAAKLGATPLWLGEEFRGVRLAAIRAVTLRTGYSRQSGLAPRVDPGVQVIYGRLDHGHPSADAIVVEEATVPSFAFGWDVTRVGAPPAGYMLSPGRGFGALLKQDGLYVNVQGDLDSAELAAAARALVPMTVSR